MNDYLRHRQKLKLEGKPPAEKKRYKIAAYSKKRQRANREYSAKTRPLWQGIPCKIRSPDCSGMSQGMHHLEGKETVEKLLNTDKMLPCCNRCNLYVEVNHAWAVARGFKLSRLKKEK
jgi:hypothetical protein